MAKNVGKMMYNYLGNSGSKVSNICLGTMTFGHNEVCLYFCANCGMIDKGLGSCLWSCTVTGCEILILGIHAMGTDPFTY